MSSGLNKSHPFRASVDSYAKQSPTESGSQSGDSSSKKKSAEQHEDDRDSLFTSCFKAFLKLSPKARLLTIAGLGGVFCYSYMSIYDAMFASPGSGSQLQNPFADSSEDFERKEVGWFAKTFCRGMKRGSFCD